MDERVKEIEEWFSTLIPFERMETTSWIIYDESMESHFKYLLQKIEELRARVVELEERCGSYKDA